FDAAVLADHAFELGGAIAVILRQNPAPVEQILGESRGEPGIGRDGCGWFGHWGNLSTRRLPRLIANRAGFATPFEQRIREEHSPCRPKRAKAANRNCRW